MKDIAYGTAIMALIMTMILGYLLCDFAPSIDKHLENQKTIIRLLQPDIAIDMTEDFGTPLLKMDKGD